MAQSLSAGTSSRRHTHSHSHGHSRGDHDTGSLRHIDTEWEAKEALRQRELEEAKARAAQMEKTMRWWSDCTANWREKWGKVRNERNKARDECKSYRMKLESVTKECATYKKEKQDLEAQNKQLKQELEKIHLLLLKHDNQTILVEALAEDEADEELSGKHSLRVHTAAEKPASSKKYASSDKSESGIEEYVLQGAVPRHAVEAFHNNGIDIPVDTKSILSQNDKSPSVGVSSDDDHEALLGGTQGGSFAELGDLENESVTSDFERKCGVGASGSDTASVQADSAKTEIAMLQLKLEEATKTAETERDEKNNLKQTVERLEANIVEWNERYEDLCQEQRRTLKDYLQMESDVLRSMRAELEDEYNSREGTDKRLADLRTELERLQAENAAEWGKRERLESEKLALERDNKKLRAEIRDFEERLSERWNRTSSDPADVELRQCQQELADRNKELSNLRHAHSKLKKALQDKSTELGHAVRRAEQYDAEVRRLRTRIEELKKDLSSAEDEIDRTVSKFRKTQRTNDELQEQIDNLNLQLDFLRNSSGDGESVQKTEGSAKSSKPEDDPNSVLW